MKIHIKIKATCGLASALIVLIAGLTANDVAGAVEAENSGPVAGDGWHLWYTDDNGALNLLSVEASADLAKPMLGQLVNMPYEVVGDAVVETPAGRFDTTHYRLMGATDLWVTGPDRILVRMVQKRFDREYLLVELDTDTRRGVEQ